MIQSIKKQGAIGYAPLLKFHNNTPPTMGRYFFFRQFTDYRFFVGEISEHTLKGIGMSLGISANLEVVTAQYIDVRIERKKTLLETYHKALQLQKPDTGKEKGSKEAVPKVKKKSSEMEL